MLSLPLFAPLYLPAVYTAITLSATLVLRAWWQLRDEEY
jgi:hypothetical protein